MKDSFVFIMAGGSGERFWPLSRAKTPKHLLRLLGNRTLLEEAFRRVSGVVDRSRIFVLTSRAQAAGARKVLRTLPASHVIIEPARRDTAPAAALATAIARSRGGDSSVCVLLPADAMIHNQAAFRSQLKAAMEAARKNDSLITVGITPHFAATGYGYLELTKQIGKTTAGTPLFGVKKFVEKPNAKRATTYFQSGRFAWNAGMFIWRAGVFCAEAKRLSPPLANFINKFPAGSFASYLKTKFPGLPKISVDYAIMEKARSVLAIKAEFDWDDVGTWTALPRHLPADKAGNVARGHAMLQDARNNIVISSGRSIALCGVSDLVVVETPDAVLVCHRDAAQDIKKLQSQMPSRLL